MKGKLPNANLANWPHIYKQELLTFEPEAGIVPTKSFPNAILVAVQPMTLERFIGALLIEGAISTECAHVILK